MKNITLLPLMVLGLLLLSGQNTVVNAQYGDGLADHCETPTEFRTVVAAPTGEDTDLTFNVTEILVPVDTCVEIKFINRAPTVEHDFVIDSQPGSDGINFVDIHVLNSTDGEYNNGTATFNIQTNGDNTFDFYCSIGDHRDEGMEGLFIVGSGGGGSEDTSFAPVFLFSAFTFVALTVLKSRRD